MISLTWVQVAIGTTMLVWLLAAGMDCRSAQGLPGFVITYPTPEGEHASRDFSVTVNSEPVFVHNCREASYVHFAFAGQVEVKVTVSEQVRDYDLSPHSYGIASTARGREITFTLTEPRKLLLHNVNAPAPEAERNRESERTEREKVGPDVSFPVSEEVLCIFADPPEDDAPRLGAPGVNNIMDYGVDSTGATDETAKIQQAIDETPINGTLFIPPGRYTFTRLRMRSDRSVYLAGGAVLQASEEQEGQISFDDASNGRLFGRGVIDGKGYLHRARRGGEEKGTVLLQCRSGSQSRNYAIEDIIVRNAPIWTCIFFDTEDWRIYNIKIVNDRQYANRDGIDPHNSQRMVLENTFMYVSDDPIAYSTTRSNLDLNTLISNCVFYNNRSGACIKLGKWSGLNTRNFTAENNDLLAGTRNEFIISLFMGGNPETGGGWQHILFRNNRVERAGRGLIRILTKWDDYYAGDRSGCGEDIVFDTLTSETHGSIDSVLQAPTPANFLKGITFNQLVIAGEAITSAEQGRIRIDGDYVSGLRFTSEERTIVGIRATRLIASASSPGEFTITRTGELSGPLNVPYTLRGTAHEGVDYERIGRSVAIPAGAASATVEIAPLRASGSRHYETVLLSLGHGDEYMLGPDFHAQVTITSWPEHSSGSARNPLGQ